jgi:type VI secretion system protein ImpI
MPLTFQLVNETTLPDGGPVSFQLSGKCAIDIGRAAHLDWTLPDPTRFISNKHCEIRYKDGGYWLHDVSTNGTFLNGAGHRMQAPHRLRNGDRFTVGHYLVAVTLEGKKRRPMNRAAPRYRRRRTQPSRPATGRDVPRFGDRDLLRSLLAVREMGKKAGRHGPTAELCGRSRRSWCAIAGGRQRDERADGAAPHQA